MFHFDIKPIMKDLISKLKMYLRVIGALILFSAVIVSCSKQEVITIEKLQCEYTEDPLGIDVMQPRFSWILKSDSRGQIQSAYQVLVASSEKNLKAGNGDKWDSGKQESGQSVNVVYQGEALASGEKCWWKVRVWDKDGIESTFSEYATFEIGLLEESDWQGEWIGSEEDISSPLLRKAFTVDKKIDQARVYICGLGFYELFINGQRVGDHVHDPATTYYNNDQPFELGSRVLYATYDVTDYLKSGQNVLGVMLGNGWYSAEDDVAPSPSGFEPYGDRPILIMQMNLESEEGEVLHVVSDRTWKTSSGPVTYNDYCHGESYDARLEKTGWSAPDYDDAEWYQAQSVQAPSGRLVSQMLPPIKVIKSIEPVKIFNPKEGVYVYDFGQSFTGWAKLRAKGPEGTKVTIRYGEMVYEDGSLDNRSNMFNEPDTEEEYLQGIGKDKRWHHHVARQTDTYILKGQGEEIWEPGFTLHGFWYAEVTGFPGTPTLESLEGRFVRSAVEEAGKFSCSNELLNRIHQNILRSFMNSLQGMLISGLNRNERPAWMGNPGFVVEDYIYNYNTASFWSKWMNDMKDSQKPNGDLPVVTPLHWRRTFDSYDGDFIDWVSTYPILSWNVYWYYGDRRILQEHYEGLKRLVDIYTLRADDHIISTGISDHMEPQPEGFSWGTSNHTPHPLTSTAYHYYNTWILARAAGILDKSEDARHYTDLAEAIKDAFNREFFDETTNQYGTGSQTSNAMALYLRLVPDGREQAVLLNLVEDILINHDGHLSTGIIGTNALAQVLGKYGRAEVMYEITTQTTFPSWGEQVLKGATTLWEAWEGETYPQLSYDHYMFGNIEKFFYRDLAGIAPASPGYGRITIKPRIVEDLTYAKASVRTVRGPVAVDWKKSDDSLKMRVTIPVNSEATVSVPKLGFKNVVITENGETVWENGKFLDGVPGITAGSDDDDYVVFDVGSGSYHFNLTVN